MQRFFFHTSDGVRDVDRVGVELADVAAARAQAVKLSGELLKEKEDVVWNGQDCRVEVTDSAGRLLFCIVTLAIDATLEIPAPKRPRKGRPRAGENRRD